MRRLLIDGPMAGKIVDYDGHTMKVAVPLPIPAQLPDQTAEEFWNMELQVEETYYRSFDIFDPGDELTGRAPSRMFVMVWENSPRIGEYDERARSRPEPPVGLSYAEETLYGTAPPKHVNCRNAFEPSTIQEAMASDEGEKIILDTIAKNPVRTMQDILREEGGSTVTFDEESFDRAAKAMGEETPPSGTDYEKLQHTEPNQNEDGTITGPDGEKRFL